MSSKLLRKLRSFDYSEDRNSVKLNMVMLGYVVMVTSGSTLGYVMFIAMITERKQVSVLIK